MLAFGRTLIYVVEIEIEIGTGAEIEAPKTLRSEMPKASRGVKG